MSIDNINWLEAIKQFLLRKGLLGVGTILIGAGIEMVAGDFIWEIIFEKVFNIIFPEQADDGSLITYRIAASILLIVLGLIAILYWFYLEAKKRFVRIEFGQYHLVKQRDNEGEWDNVLDPPYEFQIEFEIQTGNTAIHINKVSFDRYKNGHACLCKKPELKEKIPGSFWKGEPNASGKLPVYHQSFSDYTSFDVKVASSTIQKFLYKREAKGPGNPKLIGAEISYGSCDYRVHIEYRYENSQKKIAMNFSLKEEFNGNLKVISAG